MTTQPTMPVILKAVAARFKVPVTAITGPRRTENIAWARMTCAWLATQLTDLNDTEIGKALGRATSAAAYGRKTVADRISVDAKFRDLVEALENDLICPEVKR